MDLNKRVPNKRAGWNFLELIINVQGGMFPNKCAGWKNYKRLVVCGTQLFMYSLNLWNS